MCTFALTMKTAFTSASMGLSSVLLVFLSACSDDVSTGAGGAGGEGASAGSHEGGGGGVATGAGSAQGGGGGGETSEGGGGSTGEGGSGGGPTISFACPGGTIVPGVNELQVGDKTRRFNADFPEDVSQPMGALFSWHGFGDTWENHRAASALDPNADPALPVVVITPDDSGMMPPVGLDWDIAKGTPDDENVDLAFFEAMLGCLNEQFPIDPTRLYSYGFSAGSVMTSLLHSRYPKLLSAIVAVSGAWFNDEAEQELVNVFTIDWQWPELVGADGGAVLLTHGGPNDVTVFNLLDLEAAAQAAIPFLNAANRVVIDCPHDNGHTPHPDVTPAIVSKFISAHRAGEPSPLLSNPLEGYPESCTLRLP